MKSLTIAASLIAIAAGSSNANEQLIWPPDDQLPTGGTIPIKRLVESCKLESPITELCRDLHTTLTEGMEQ